MVWAEDPRAAFLHFIPPMNSPNPNPTEGESAADLLRRTIERSSVGPVSLDQALGATGTRAHALALALFSLPEALPLPVAGLSAVLALPLILISGHLLVMGGRRPLPDFLLQRKLNPNLLRLVGPRAETLLRRFEAVSRPRLIGVVRRERLLAGACLLLALVVALPIPFWNMPPAICLLLISLGMLQRDGLLALTGLLGLIMMSVGAIFLADVLVRFLAP